MAQRREAKTGKQEGFVRSMASAIMGGIGRMAGALEPDDDLNAIDLLKAQHRYVERLFATIEETNGARRDAVFRELADMLAVHATIEEKIFYPSVKTPATEDLLRESVEEHLAMKRMLADLMEMGVDDDEFDAKLQVLQEQVTHHAKQEEERKLFPLVRTDQNPDFLAALAGEMIALMVTLQERGSPRDAVPSELSASAPI
jgi:hemerythrin superfamily protein